MAKPSDFEKLHLAASLPDEVKEEALHIERLYRQMREYISIFYTAVDLFTELNKQHSQTKDGRALYRIMQWSFIAGRDGATTIYNFGETLNAMHNQVHANEQIKQIARLDQLRLAATMLKKAFPAYESLRHSVAHGGQMLKTVKEERSHVVKEAIDIPGFLKEPGGGIFLGGNMIGNTYLVGYKGRAVSYDLSPESVNKLGAIWEKVYAALNQPESDPN